MKLEHINNPKDAIFGPQTKIIELKKNNFLLAPNKVEKYLYYVISGIVGSFVEHNGDESCTGFYTSQNYFSEYASFITQNKSETYSRVLKNCRLACIHYNVLQEDYKNSIEHQILGRKISEQLYIRLQKRNINLLTLSAKERYLKFIKERPEEVKEVAQKYIASYLGMTPVSLSRLRKDLIS